MSVTVMQNARYTCFFGSNNVCPAATSVEVINAMAKFKGVRPSKAVMLRVTSAAVSGQQTAFRIRLAMHLTL